MLHHAQLAERINAATRRRRRRSASSARAGSTPQQALATVNRMIDQQAYTLAVDRPVPPVGVLFFVLLVAGLVDAAGEERRGRRRRGALSARRDVGTATSQHEARGVAGHLEVAAADARPPRVEQLATGPPSRSRRCWRGCRAPGRRAGRARRSAPAGVVDAATRPDSAPATPGWSSAARREDDLVRREVAHRAARRRRKLPPAHSALPSARRRRNAVSALPSSRFMPIQSQPTAWRVQAARRSIRGRARRGRRRRPCGRRASACRAPRAAARCSSGSPARRCGPLRE